MARRDAGIPAAMLAGYAVNGWFSAEREIAIVRDRAMMPSVMSIATDTADAWAEEATVIKRIPGTT